MRGDPHGGRANRGQHERSQCCSYRTSPVSRCSSASTRGRGKTKTRSTTSTTRRWTSRTVSRGTASSAGCPSSGRRKRIGSPVAASRAGIKSTTRMRTSRYPPQCALVASYRNTSETLVPRGRKRNRMYLGLLRADLLENDGTIIAGDATAVRSAMNELNTALEGITDADPIFAPQGLAIVSPTAGECYEVNEVGCGEAVDTHRSRRQKEPENMIWQAAS